MKIKTFSFVFAALLLLVVGCDKSESIESGLVSNANSRFRTYDEALALAEQTMSLLSDVNTKSGRARVIDDWFAIESSSTKSGQADTLVYVFNFADSAGFSIITANPSVSPFFAVTEAGHLGGDMDTGVPSFDHYLSDALYKLDSLNIYVEPDDDARYLYQYKIEGDSIVPLLGQTKWGQNGTYGALCPNGYSGCFATAIGQIMKIFSYPTQFIASCNMQDAYSSGETINLHWDYIDYHEKNHTDSTACSLYHNEISAILRDIGEVASSDYRNDGSGTWTYNTKIVPTLQHYGFTSSLLVSANTSSMINSLNQNYPICMFSPGHFYVVDGYKDYKEIRYKYERKGFGDVYVLTETSIVEEVHAMHINWGWNGNCNGYFAFGTYNTADAVEYDASSNSGSHDYTSGAQMVYNIHPIN